MIAFALAVMLAFGMTACGDNTSSGTQSASSASAPGASPLIPDGPAPEINLITGEALAEGLAAGDRPVAVMVNNAQAALPQRGIGSADAVFEMVTEGGITRLLALYADKDTVPQVGPVRSARDQHLQCAMPLNSVIVHIGTSIYAENLLNQYQYSTINGMYLGSTSFVFDEARSAAGYANEHCWYTDAALIAAGMEKLGLSGTGASQALFDFVAHDAQPVVPAQGDAADVAFSFSDSGAVTLTYDAAAAKYLKTAYGAPQVDESTGAQLAFDNVLVLFTDIKLKNPDDPNNLVTDFAMSSGTGYYCYGGKFRAVTWEKGNPEDPLRLKDENGAALQVNVGKSYVAIVGKDREGTLLFGGVSPTGVIGGEGASSDAQSGAAADKVVYLTFDDGPSATTESVLDTLKAEGVPATFFVMAADNNEEYLPLLERTVQEGHLIALHTCSHDYKSIYKSPDAYWDDLQKLREKLLPYVPADHEIKWLRFPGGSTNTVSHRYGGSDIMKKLKADAESRGFTYVDWNVCAEDSLGGHPSASTIYNNIIREVGDKNTCVVLMHDTNATKNTAAALPDVIRWFKNAGYRFDTVDHLEKKI